MIGSMVTKKAIYKVTRKGQITIPSGFRARHDINEGALVQIVDQGSRLVVEPVPDLLSLLGADEGKYSLTQLKKMLDESRRRWR